MKKSSASDPFVIENCIIRYPHVFVAQKPQNATTPRYSVKAYLTEQGMQKVYQVAKTLAESHFMNQEYNLPSFSWPLSAANLKPKDAQNPRLANCYVINPKASLEYPPSVIDAQRQPIMDQSQVYSGCIGSVALRLFTYEPMNNFGIGAGLVALMKTADGQPIEDDGYDLNELFGPPTSSGTGQPSFLNQKADQNPSFLNQPQGGGQTEENPFTYPDTMPKPPFLQDT